MGTRNLTLVIKDKEPKIAQYGQWDGYPSGQGRAILDFISQKGNLDKLESSLSKVRFLDYDGIDKEFIDNYNSLAPKWSSDPDNRTAEQKNWWDNYMTRDLGGSIMEKVANSQDETILLGNKISFAADSLFCEWAYVIDFDKKTFEVYKGFNRSPLEEGDRFYSMKKEGEYEPVKMVREYDLRNLPTQDDFINSFEESQED